MTASANVMSQPPDAHLPQPARGKARWYLIAFSTCFGLWVVAMLAMYFLTVYPQRHPHVTQSAVVSQPVR